eukprot:gene7478-8749_t
MTLFPFDIIRTFKEWFLVYGGHGVLKVKTSEEKAKAMKEREILQIAEYRKVVSDYELHKESGELNEAGLAVSKKVLEINPEYYSIWNYRRDLFVHFETVKSALLPRMYPETMSMFEKVKEEFELVRNAVFTDPKDQSPWIYHKWLVGTIKAIPDCNYKDVLKNEIEQILDLLDMEPDSKCMLFIAIAME